MSNASLGGRSRLIRASLATISVLVLQACAHQPDLHIEQLVHDPAEDGPHGGKAFVVLHNRGAGTNDYAGSLAIGALQATVELTGHRIDRDGRLTVVLGDGEHGPGVIYAGSKRAVNSHELAGGVALFRGERLIDSLFWATPGLDDGGGELFERAREAGRWTGAPVAVSQSEPSCPWPKRARRGTPIERGANGAWQLQRADADASCACSPSIDAAIEPFALGEDSILSLAAWSTCGLDYLLESRFEASLDGVSLQAAIEGAYDAGDVAVSPPDRSLRVYLESLPLRPGNEHELVVRLRGPDDQTDSMTQRVWIPWPEPPVVLGELFGRVTAGVMTPPVPVAGNALSMLVGGDPEVLADADVDIQLAPVGNEAGPSGFVSLAAEWQAFDRALDTSLRAVTFRLPERASPGFYWIRTRIGSHFFKWRQLEIAAPDSNGPRERLFSRMEALLEAAGENPADFQQRAPYDVTDAPMTVYRYPSASPLALPAGTRLTYAERVQSAKVPGSAPMYLLTQDGGRAEPVFASADHWLLYAPGAPPPADKGWYWDRRNNGGTCGTAQCRFGYPYPGNRGNDITIGSSTVSVVLPTPNPIDWWRNRPRRNGGGICGTGWCNGPFGGARFPPWPTRPRQPPPAPDDGPEEREPPREPTTERPPLTSRPRPVPTAPPPAPTCTAEFVEAVAGYTYRDKPKWGVRTRTYDPRVPRNAIYTNLPTRSAMLHYSVIPSSYSRTTGLVLSWPNGRVLFEIEGARRWFAQYCINLSFNPVRLRPSHARRLGMANAQTVALLPVSLNATVQGRALAMSRTLLGAAVYAHHRASRRRDRRDVSVLFMDRVIGNAGVRAASARPSQASHNVLNFNGVALHSADADDDYILTHELTHAYGRIHGGGKEGRETEGEVRSRYYRDSMTPGPHSWYHDSAAPNAMSRVIRRSVAEAANLSFDRKIDYAEYDDFLRSNLLRR